jgi:hypothetical protein
VFAAGVRHFQGEGYVLVAFLFTCKLIETVTEHQYNFFCARLDMYVKSALTAAVYRKVSLGLVLLSRIQNLRPGDVSPHLQADRNDTGAPVH